MEQIFNSELRDGEKLVWTSKSGQFKAWNNLNKKSLIWLASIMIAIIVVFGILTKSLLITAITTVLCLVPVLCLIIHTSKENRVLKSCVYALTDQRAIVYNGDYHSKDYQDIVAARQIVDPDGIVSMYFGTDKNITADSLLKTFTVDTLKPGKSQLGNDFVFFAVDDYEEVTNTLKKYIPVDNTIKCKFALEQS